MYCKIDGNVTAIVDQIPQDSFKLVKEEVKTSKKDGDNLSSDDENVDDNDSVFSDDKKAGETSWSLVDLNRNGRVIRVGSKIKLQIREVTVTEGTIISHATLL